MLTTLGTDDGDLDPLSHSGGVGSRNGREAFILCLLAGLAALRWIFQSLVVKEGLLPRCPDKLLVAINTYNSLIVIFARRGNFGREDFGL